MSYLTLILTIIGLAVFETISSIDNAIINAEVLATMRPKAKRWFLVWGMLFAIFIIRGFLPWIIVYLSVPSLGFIGAFTASFSGNQTVLDAVTKASPILLGMGGMFLILLFLHWLFLEDKHIGLYHEKFFLNHGTWFYASASVMLAIVEWYALKLNYLMAFGIIVGSTLFFITHGFKQYAEEAEQKLKSDSRSDFAKILYLEIIDATFSIDGVLGAFAFTLAVPLILIGNGIGAIVVRQLTVSNVENIRQYVYLKNGAMYSIVVLGILMLINAFGVDVPEWISPILTIIIVGYFFLKSHFARRRRSES